MHGQDDHFGELLTGNWVSGPKVPSVKPVMM